MKTITIGQTKQYRRFVEDATQKGADIALQQIPMDKDGIQRLIENGDEFNSAIAAIIVEKTREFRGRYHVLGGALSPIDGVEPGDLHLAELATRVQQGVDEVIVATNPTMTGEATALYIADLLPDRVQVTRLASGLPVGGDLEYADELTLGRALSGRLTMPRGSVG